MKTLPGCYGRPLWLLAFLIMHCSSLFAQVTKVSERTIGGTGFETGRVVLTTSDGGYILGGISQSNTGNDKSEDRRGSNDYWVVKYNANGEKQWDRTFGGKDTDELKTLIATPDGGYLLGGFSISQKGDDKSEDNHGDFDMDIWVVKINANGEKQWDKTLGGDQTEFFSGMVALSDGYFVVGTSSSNTGGDKSADSKGDGDIWLIKLGMDGQKIWDKTIGGNGYDGADDIQPTSDGNFMILGTSNSSISGDKTANSKGDYDYWLVKVNGSGEVLWDKTIGGSNYDQAASLTNTADNGFLIGGTSSSGIGYDKSETRLSGGNYWAVKVDASGNKQWDRTLGGAPGENCYRTLALADGGFLVGGVSFSSTSPVKSEPSRGNGDYWVVKLSADGHYVWDKTLGGSDRDYLGGMAQTASGDILLLGESDSPISGDKTQAPIGDNDNGDFWLVVLRETPCTTPSLSAQTNVAQPVLQNYPGVTLVVEGCETGRITWNGPGGGSGVGPTIPVVTSAVGTHVYSVTCTRGNCSATLSPTVAVGAPSVSGAFDGYIYGADCNGFRGWAWDGNKPNTPVTVEILEGATVVGTIVANEFRQDLLNAGKGNGNHAFRFPIPESLRDFTTHYLTARVRGSNFNLKGTPQALQCYPSWEAPVNKAPVAPTPTVLIAPLTAQVGVPFSATLVPFTDPDGDEITYWVNPLPSGLVFDYLTRVISGTPLEAGTTVVLYQADDQFGNTNNVSFPITVNPASTTNVTGSFDGYLDKVECGTIRGWVWDRNKPNTPLTVEFYHATTKEVFGSTYANIYRSDLQDAGKGNGAHAYRFEVPVSLKDGTTRPIMARVQGSTFELKGGPKNLSCNVPVRLSAESSEGLQVTVLGNPAVEHVQVEIRGAEGQPLRLQLTDAGGRLVSQRQLEAAKAIEQQILSVGPYPAGLLLLRVSSGLNSVTVKIVKQ
ncbi:putative Ig domain-containing protein [Larkinella rosea]|uniref:T9SS C-terminal target domain-containing protein n=1 Tax=Larkinella rosea TaxID=2025312 RepID=A0A3P1BGL4_9BACT|nr:putative Ig domain-containing protein [Larkinella rosea]RRA99982.1 hypothetical protein EHT25_25500 [Larkinella rosea]